MWKVEGYHFKSNPTSQRAKARKINGITHIAGIAGEADGRQAHTKISTSNTLGAGSKSCLSARYGYLYAVAGANMRGCINARNWVGEDVLWRAVMVLGVECLNCAFIYILICVACLFRVRESRRKMIICDDMCVQEAQVFRTVKIVKLHDISFCLPCIPKVRLVHTMYNGK